MTPEQVAALLKEAPGVIWPIAFLIVIWFLRKQIKELANAAVQSIPQGGAIEIWKIKLKGAVIKGKNAPVHLRGFDIDETKRDDTKPEPYTSEPATHDEFTYRRELRYAARFVRLVHTAIFTSRKEWPYDMSVYVIIEKIPPDYERDRGATPARLTDIERVEYYFGHYFGKGPDGDRYVMRNVEENFGVKFATDDGGVFCVAKVYFHDGSKEVEIHRFLDVEMGRLLKDQAETSFRQPRRTRSRGRNRNVGAEESV